MSMKGAIYERRTKSGVQYGVRWYIGKKKYIITRYKGVFIGDAKPMADRLLSVMRADDETPFFRIEKYTNQEVDTIDYLNKWIALQTHLSPATEKDYQNSIKNHLIPWFEVNKVSLNDIQYDVLCQLLKDIKREGKGKQNVMFCLHAALISAHESGKILQVPPFPKKRLYQIEPKPIQAIPESRQIAIINAIPEEHQPIFWWLKYHYRRPSEAMALFKEDYDKERDCFIIQRSFSNKRLVTHTKTHHIHTIPCHPDFREWTRRLHISFGPYYFTHRGSRLEGQRYQHDFLVDLWNRAARSKGESIRLYAGIKHSSCTAAINEHGMSVDELQMLTDHARRDSVLKYADIQLEAKRNIQAKVIKMRVATKQTHEENSGSNS